MAMVVKNNMSAVRTLNTLNSNSSALQGSLAKVSSGMKINSAQDDASGYAISERMRVQIRSLDQANQNTQNGSSLMKTAEGAVSKTVEILKSLKEKAISAATDTNTDSDRVTIQKEIDQFIDQIDDNALVTFNGKYLVDGSKTQAGKATYTAMTNQSLFTDTKGSDALTNLKNRNNESLEITSTDYVTASFVKDGSTYTTKFQVGEKTLENVFERMNTQYQAETGKTDTAIFGAAHLSEPSDEQITKYKGIVAAADTTALFKVVANANDTGSAGLTGQYSDTTVKELGEAVAALGTDTYAQMTWNGSVSSYDDAVTNFKGLLDTAYANTTIGNISGTAAGELPVGTTLDVDLKADVDGTDVSVGTQQYKVTAELTTAGGLTLGAGNTPSQTATVDTTNLSKAISDYALTATADADIDSVVDGASTVTATAASEWSNGVASTGAVVGAVSGATAVDMTDGKAKDFKQAAALQHILNNLGGGGLVSKGSDVGLAASGDMVSTANGETGLTVTAATGEIAGQISGLSLSITDSQGNVKKSANASLDAFKTTIFAANKSDDNALKFQVGATSNLSITVGLADMRSEALGLKGSDGSKVSVATQAKANAAIATFDNALQKALDIQTTIGAVEARLDYTSSNLTTSSENVQAAESTIRDADMAKEMTNYTKNNVLLQAAQSMLAQANQNSSAVLSLLQ